MKKILYLLAALVFTVAVLASARTAYADVLFEHEFREEQGGVIYERVLQMTTNGMLDIHVLTVPLNDPYIYIGPVVSQHAGGRRETATTLLSDAGAVAGINADFFGLAGLYSVHFGPMIMDGEILGLNPHTNHDRNEFASFFLDSNGNPFFDYIRSEVRFYNNGTVNIRVASLNVIGQELRSPVIVDGRLMDNTRQLSDRFDGLTKFVVRGNTVTQVSRDVVEVPADGYVLVLPAHMYSSHRHLVNVGDTARLHLGNNLGVDFSRIQTAIGGGGLILSNGETMYGRGVAPNARHPRSAIGVTRDGNSLILMVVDGRSHSIGATHVEMAGWLRRFGAWDAMHFDGGGSSTMIVRDAVTGAYATVNTPSDGAERRIINALGVFDSRPFEPVFAPIPQMAELRSHPRAISMFGEGQQMTFRLSGVAANGNYVANVPLSYVSDFAVVPPGLGFIENGVFTATGSGTGHIVVTVHDVNTYIAVSVGGTSQVLNTSAVIPGFAGYPLGYATGEAERYGDILKMEYSFFPVSRTQAAHMTLYPPVVLPANSVAINIMVEGDGSGNWLRGRVRDGAGRHHNIDFANDIDFYDWAFLTAALPAGVPGPFMLERIYVVTLGTRDTTARHILIGGIEAVIAYDLPADIPVGPVFRDLMWMQDGFGDFGGNEHRFILPNTDYDVEYDIANSGPFSIATMTLYGGRLGTHQWGRFMRDIRSTNPSYVVILMDRNPRTAFRHAAEFELFHMAMVELQAEGRTVFVVSATGSATSVHIQDGIRYINLYRESEYIYFRVNGNQIRWSD